MHSGGTWGLQYTCRHVDCKCTWMWENTFPYLPWVLPGVTLLFSQVLCSSFPGCPENCPFSYRSLLPCSVPGWLIIMAVLKASILLSFCCFLPVADTAEERCESQRGGGVGNLYPPVSVNHFGEHTHFNNAHLCACVSPLQSLFYPKLLPCLLSPLEDFVGLPLP